MRSRIIRRIRARLRGLIDAADTAPVLDRNNASSSYIPAAERVFRSGVDEFYRRLLKNNLRSFNSFALQSRSRFARDVYAYVATDGRCDFESLVFEIDDILDAERYESLSAQQVPFNPEMLLSLASYVLDTARSDLDTQAGVQILRLLILKYGDESLTDHHKMQFVESLAELENYSEQSEFIDRFDISSLSPMQAELMEVDRLAKQGAAAREWVESMNRLYASLGMATIKLYDDANLPLLDRLVSDTNTAVEGPKISVIMPTYSPTTRIFTALASLLRQTWSNLEILVVDDGSPSEFDEILKRIEQLDPRITVIRQQQNAGAYVARRAGLSRASGEYVTTHDDDDWSHPEKLATQANVLMEDPTVVATTSAHIRTTQDMHFKRINSRPRHLQTNYSSMLFRKSVTDEIGGWDTSSRGSDTELAGRIIANFGKSSVVNLTAQPLSFSRVWAGSLTSGEVYRGYFTYSRLLYRWAFRQWHRRAKRNGGRPILEDGKPRPFAVPTTFEPEDRYKDLGVFDLIFVTDYSRHSRFVDSVLRQMESAVSAKLRVGYMHLNSPQTLKRADIPSQLFDLQLAGKITQVADNNRAEARLMVVYDASIGMFLDEFTSSVVVHRGVVVDDQGAALRRSERRNASHPRTALRNLDQSFNSRFCIVGAALEEQETLRKQVPPERLLGNQYIWSVPNIDGASTIAPPKSDPVIGFHSFGNKFRWPTTREQFNSVYYSAGYEVVFYGLLHPARAELGDDIFARARQLSPKQTELSEFFKEIDFWVYFPHERLLDRPWSAVLAALQAGKVVIMPPYLEAIYGEAAVYAQPEEVASVVADLAGNSDKFMAQAKRGQEVVAKKYSQRAYIQRLHELMLG